MSDAVITRDQAWCREASRKLIESGASDRIMRRWFSLATLPEDLPPGFRPSAASVPASP